MTHQGEQQNTRAAEGPKDRVSIMESVKWAGGAGAPVALFSLASHSIGGLLVAGAIAFVAARHGQQALESVHDHLELPAVLDKKLAAVKAKKRQGSNRTPMQRILGQFPEQDKADTADAPVVARITTTQAIAHDAPVTPASLFAQTARDADAPVVARITTTQAIAHIERNSYQVYVGRSLSLPESPAKKINFFKQHIKLIGASQHGKSSMAAAFIEMVTTTHDPGHVQFALLDLEDKTSRLFATIPHIARVRIHGVPQPLYARTYDEVLEHLGYISTLVDLRYSLPPTALERLPLLVVYVEEFLDLKNQFKQRIAAAPSGEERDRATADYEVLVYGLKKIAMRGLKAHIQLLLCSQVDYRDNDLVEALVNVTAGMSFCVRPSAAQAAGFSQTEMLSRNYREDRVGQMVVETPDLKDLILAVDFDLEAHLKALDPLVGDRITERDMTEFEVAGAETSRREEEVPPLRANPRLLTGLHRTALEHYQPHIGYRRLGELIGVGKDKAGDLLRDLKKWGFIEDDSDQ